MDYDIEYRRWLGFDGLDKELRAELSDLPESEIRERFYAPLKFGTAGLRGIMGAGINRMNVYTVAAATKGLADAIIAHGRSADGVVICFDCRRHSEEFARLAASVMAEAGIHVRLFDAMRPTPELSFAIRHYGCVSGINITASHNPKEYNGYKAYWDNGAQTDDALADEIAAGMDRADLFNVPRADFNTALADGRIAMLGGETDELFLEAVLSNRIRPEATEGCNLCIVYTPFHGTGYKLVPEALRRIGLTNVVCVPEQMIPDGSFPTVKSPNPEERAGFALAVALAEKVGSDFVIGTDPDADRVGLIVRDHAGEYVTLSGNQTGILLTDYIITSRREKGLMPSKPAVLSTIVTSLMARRVCEENGVCYGESFTGFRFIAELMEKLAAEGYTSLLGFEESYGYMIGSHCRDKDAVTASVLIAEMAAYYASRGMTLYDAMQSLYAKYGAFSEQTLNLRMPGVDGLEKMRALMASLRAVPPSELGGYAVTALRDYESGLRTCGGETERMALSGSDVLAFETSGGDRVVVRPSGTEPKIKIYILTSGASLAETDGKVAKYRKSVEALTE